MIWSRDISIKLRFNYILIGISVLVLLSIAFFLFSIRQLNRYESYFEKTAELKVHYLNLKRHNLQFLLNYNDDANFFISEKSKYVNKFNKSSKSFSGTISGLLNNKISEDAKVREILISIENRHQNYREVFYDLSHKIYIRGDIHSGIIGKLKAAEKEMINNKKYIQSKDLISEIILYTDNYLFSQNEQDYAEFLKRYKRLLASAGIAEAAQITDSVLSQNSEDKNILAYNAYFTALINSNKIIGSNKEGLIGDLQNNEQSLESEINRLLTSITDYKDDFQKRRVYPAIVLFILLSGLFILFFKKFLGTLTKSLQELRNYIKPVSLGIFPEEKPDIEGNKEIQEIYDYTNKLIHGLEKTTEFTQEIGKGNYDVPYTPLSDKDTLGNALVEMKENILITAQKEEKRKKEDEVRRWTNEGLTKFNDILRQTQGNIQEMSSKLISELVEFVHANQGGIFVFNDSEEDKYLELTAAYAYGHEKKKKKKIYPKEGIVGMAAVEKKTVYMTEIPETYITITSGLGEAVPRSLLIVPMITENEVIGVTELASFNEFKKYEIEFVEILAETIAASLSVTKINERTAALLAQSQEQGRKMQVQEEEMRHNFKLLEQAQKDLYLKTTQMSGVLEAIETGAFVMELDLEGNIFSINKKMLALLKINKEDYLNKKLSKLIEIEDEEAFNKAWKEIVAGANIQRDEHIITENEEFFLSTVYSSIVDENGDVLYIYSIATDLTESKKLEAELKKREKYLKQNLEEIEKARKEAEKKQHILENTNEMLEANEKTLQIAVQNAMVQRKELAKKMSEAVEKDAETASWNEGIFQTHLVAEFDTKHNIISTNGLFQKAFGYTEEELKNKNHDILVSKEEVASETYKKRWERLDAGFHVSNIFSFVNKKNKVLYIQGGYISVKNHKGKVVKTILTGFDISEFMNQK